MKILNHGIKLPDFKDISLSSPRLKRAPLPGEVAIFLQQHEGLPAIPIVRENDQVYTGTKLAAAQTDFSANVHSSISGRVSEVSAELIRVESNGKDEWDP